ncbi:MAG TPA: succinyl-diaminopimelate desuccinylase [Thermohalobaculum sp.]|nr:succinyl-diaminopimelate desuccinylase [Thermohalobaculum sp.]
MTAPIDPVELTAALVRCPSVTPEEGGALRLIEERLTPLGFRCTRISRGGVENLYARWGDAAPVFAFNGHTDVVPAGDAAAWTHPPFGAEAADGHIWGRGSVDMKSGVAAFVAAAAALVDEAPPAGSIALLVTGDEEGEAVDGTAAILDWMRANGEQADVCIVGEPTAAERLGDTVKIGRRGSATGYLAVTGRQGHSAYPESALNPLPVLARICVRLAEAELDRGSEHFQPSTLALTSIDVGNPANNVIPAEGRAVFNIRFNDRHTSDSLAAWAGEIVAEECARDDAGHRLDWQVSGESFLTPPGPFTDLVSDVLEAEGFGRPALTTGGGTSDARFVRDMCPVLELGLVGRGMHQTDERVPEEDVRALAVIYRKILERYFQAG